MPLPSPADQERLYPTIGAALLKSVPEEWGDVLLRIRTTESGQIQLEIQGPGGVSNLRVPDDSLYQPVIELYDLFVRHASPFDSCDFSLQWDSVRETWRFTARYAYPSSA